VRVTRKGDAPGFVFGDNHLVGVLKGDVNGSWAAPAGSVDLDALNPTYFSTLASTLGVPTDQWGV